jgi:hypothetical protein
MVITDVGREPFKPRSNLEERASLHRRREPVPLIVSRPVDAFKIVVYVEYLHT